MRPCNVGDARSGRQNRQAYRHWQHHRLDEDAELLLYGGRSTRCLTEFGDGMELGSLLDRVFHFDVCELVDIEEIR